MLSVVAVGFNSSRWVLLLYIFFSPILGQQTKATPQEKDVSKETNWKSPQSCVFKTLSYKQIKNKTHTHENQKHNRFFSWYVLKWKSPTVLCMQKSHAQSAKSIFKPDKYAKNGRPPSLSFVLLSAHFWIRFSIWSIWCGQEDECFCGKNKACWVTLGEELHLPTSCGEGQRFRDLGRGPQLPFFSQKDCVVGGLERGGVWYR